MGNPNGNPNTNGAGAGLDGSGEYNLAGRQFVKRPSLSDKTQQEGKIVVFIWVDPEGNVTRSQAGAKGTSIGNRDLWEKYEAAALNAKFSVAENAPAEQRGTLTFILASNESSGLCRNARVLVSATTYVSTHWGCCFKRFNNTQALCKLLGQPQKV